MYFKRDIFTDLGKIPARAARRAITRAYHFVGARVAYVIDGARRMVTFFQIVGRNEIIAPFRQNKLEIVQRIKINKARNVIIFSKSQKARVRVAFCDTIPHKRICIRVIITWNIYGKIPGTMNAEKWRVMFI